MADESGKVADEGAAGEEDANAVSRAAADFVEGANEAKAKVDEEVDKTADTIIEDAFEVQVEEIGS